MLYIGLDVHSKWMTIKGSSPRTGELIELKRIPNDGDLAEVFGGLHGPLYGVTEAGTNSWAMYRKLLPFFEKLVVADPSKLWDRRRDRGAKTDGRDALRMAEMLYRGEIEPLYIPDEHTQDLRVLVRGKVRISRWVTRLTNEIGSLLRSWDMLAAGVCSVDILCRTCAQGLPKWRELFLRCFRQLGQQVAALRPWAAGTKDCPG